MTDLESLAGGTGQQAREARRTLKRRAAARAVGGGDDDDFAPLLGALSEIAGRINGGEQKRMARDVANVLRDANARRERANVQPPDDEAMTPRKQPPKGKAGRKFRAKRLREAAERKQRRGLMFRKAYQPRFLRRESSQGGVQVGFVGAMARIMRVHQYGLRDHVTRAPDSPTVVYAQRLVLGITPDDRQRILERITAQVAP